MRIPCIVQEIPGSTSVTILILFHAGSRFETEKNSGVAHFLEHMFFKGGKDFVSARAVAYAIDGIGGVHNAFTSKEIVGYYVKLSSEKIEQGMHVLSDMLQHAKFHPDEIEKEKGVIVEELRMYQDMPQYLVEHDFDTLMFGAHPLGREIGGTEEHVLRMTQTDFLAYKDTLYTPDNMVVSVAGGVDKGKVEKLVEKYLTEMRGEKSMTAVPWSKQTDGFFTLRKKETDQAHLIMGVYGVGRHDPLKVPLNLVATILGGNSSSRMFQRLREDQGICYYVSASSDSYEDTGMFTMRAGVSLEKIEEALDAIEEEFYSLTKHPVSKEELSRAKEYWKGHLSLSLEDSEELAYFHGVRHLFGQETDIMAVFQAIDAVTLENIEEAVAYLATQKIKRAIIGPYDESRFTRYI